MYPYLLKKYILDSYMLISSKFYVYVCYLAHLENLNIVHLKTLSASFAYFGYVQQLTKFYLVSMLS